MILKFLKSCQYFLEIFGRKSAFYEDIQLMELDKCCTKNMEDKDRKALRVSEEEGEDLLLRPQIYWDTGRKLKKITSHGADIEEINGESVLVGDLVPGL